MVTPLGLIRFTNALGGTADFIYPGPAIDMQSPATAAAVNAAVYVYYSQSLDMTEWERGSGAYNSATGTFARTTVSANSLGTLAKINFSNPPQVMVFDSSFGGGSGSPGTIVPNPEGVGAVGTSANWAHEDHVHPVMKQLAATANFNTITTPGRYYTQDPSSTNAPVAAEYWYLTVEQYGINLNYAKQVATRLETGGAETYTRISVDSAGSPSWSAWVQFAFLNSPAFTGVPTAPTAAPGTNTNQLATTAFVTAAGSFLQAGTGAVSRTFQNKDRDIVSVLDFGADNTGATSAVAAIQATITYATSVGKKVLVPAGLYKIDAGLTITAGVIIMGEGWQPYITAPSGTTPAVQGLGTWFLISHTGAPFITVQQGANRTNGIVLRDFAMKWTGHPAIGVGWTPTAYDWAVKIIGSEDVTLENLMFLNPYKGVQMTWKGAGVGQAGRLNMRNCFGQPLFTAVDIDWAADVCHLDRLHFWPFWSDNANVLSYMQANATFFRSGRSDNTQGSNWFGYAYGQGILLDKGPDNNVTSRLKLTNIEFDSTRRAIWISSNAAGSSGQIENVSIVCDPTVTTADAFVSEAAAVDFDWVNMRISNSHSNSVLVTGTNAKHRMLGLWCDAWDLASSGFAAISAAANTEVYAEDGKYTGSASPIQSGAGKIVTGQWFAYTPTLSTGAGTLTTASVTGRYKRSKASTQVFVQATITTNGTGATSVIVTLPFAAVTDAIFAGREKNATGNAVTGTVLAGSSNLTIFKYDNSYPGGNSTILDLSGVVETA